MAIDKLALLTSHRDTLIAILKSVNTLRLLPDYQAEAEILWERITRSSGSFVELVQVEPNWHEEFSEPLENSTEAFFAVCDQVSQLMALASADLKLAPKFTAVPTTK